MCSIWITQTKQNLEDIHKDSLTCYKFYHNRRINIMFHSSSVAQGTDTHYSFRSEIDLLDIFLHMLSHSIPFLYHKSNISWLMLRMFS